MRAPLATFDFPPHKKARSRGHGIIIHPASLATIKRTAAGQTVAIHSTKLVTHYIYLSLLLKDSSAVGTDSQPAERKFWVRAEYAGRILSVCVFCARCSSSGETQDANQAEIETSMSRSFFLNKVRHAPARCMVFL